MSAKDPKKLTKAEQDLADELISHEHHGLIKSIYGRFKRAIIGLKGTAHASSVVDALGNNLSWLSLLGSALILPLYMYRLVRTSLKKEMTGSRIFKIAYFSTTIALSFIGMAVTIGLLPIAAPILIIAGAVKDIVEGFFGMIRNILKRKEVTRQIGLVTAEIKSKKGQNQNANIKRLTDLKNQQRNYNSKIAEKAHGILQDMAALVGGILMLTPAAPIGIIIIVATGAYGFADAINLNPLRWIARGIMRAVNHRARKHGKPPVDPFTPVNENDVANELGISLTETPGATDTIKAAKTESTSTASETAAPAAVGEPALPDNLGIPNALAPLAAALAVGENLTPDETPNPEYPPTDKSAEPSDMDTKIPSHKASPDRTTANDTVYQNGATLFANSGTPAPHAAHQDDSDSDRDSAKPKHSSHG